MKRAYWVMGLLAAGIFSGPALADGYPAVQLFSGNKTAVGEEIAWPATGKANVNAMLVTIAPGERTELHRHGVPLFVYVLEGDLQVEYEGVGTKEYKAGDSFLEAMGVTHTGINSSAAPVRILAVYMGADGLQDVIPENQ